MKDFVWKIKCNIYPPLTPSPTVADPGFPRWGGGVPTSYFCIFCLETEWKWIKFGPREGARHWRPLGFTTAEIITKEAHENNGADFTPLVPCSPHHDRCTIHTDRTKASEKSERFLRALPLPHHSAWEIAALIAVINVPHSSSGSLCKSGISTDVSFFTAVCMTVLQATHDWPK